MKERFHRGASYGTVALVYGAAAVAGVLVYRTASGSPLVKMLLADLAATVLVYLMSVPLGNASVYDPYWSVAPMVMVSVLISSLISPLMMIFRLFFTVSPIFT